MTLHLIDLQAQYHRHQAEIDRRMRAVLDHGQYIMGPEVVELEGELAAFSGAKHAVTLANGTDALQIALMALGVGPGDAVFTPSFTFTATAEVIVILGAEPVFVDVRPENFNIDTADLERKIADVRAENRLTPKAIIAVDLFGQPADYDALSALAQREGLAVVGDGAQSFGAALHERRVGTLCDITTTSFFPAKPLGCYGDGGALLCDDAAIADAARSIRQHGKGSAKYEIVRYGVNSRLDTLQAAVLLAKLPHFEDEIAARNRVAARYEERLGDVVTTPSVVAGARSVWAQYTIRHAHRDALMDHLKTQGIPSAVYYPQPMHLQTAYQCFGSGEGGLPVCQSLSQEVLSLPMHPYLSDEDVDFIADAICGFVNR